MVAEHAELLCVQRVRPAGLNGKFRQRAEMPFNMREQAVKLVGFLFGKRRPRADRRL